jgi:hypothetical protein
LFKQRKDKTEGEKFALRLETVAVSGKSTKSSGTVNDLMLSFTAIGAIHNH